MTRSAPEPRSTTPELVTAPLLTAPSLVSRHELSTTPGPLIVSRPTTVMSAVLVTLAAEVSEPPMVTVALFVTVPPLRLTDPSTSISPSFVRVSPGPSDTSAPASVIVPVARFVTVASPLTLGGAVNVTVPSLSRMAPLSAASAGSVADPRTSRWTWPPIELGLNAAGVSTQIVAPPALTGPVNVPDVKSTTSVAIRFKLAGIVAASNVCVGFAQSTSHCASARCPIARSTPRMRTTAAGPDTCLMDTRGGYRRTAWPPRPRSDRPAGGSSPSSGWRCPSSRRRLPRRSRRASPGPRVGYPRPPLTTEPF